MVSKGEAESLPPTEILPRGVLVCRHSVLTPAHIENSAKATDAMRSDTPSVRILWLDLDLGADLGPDLDLGADLGPDLDLGADLGPDLDLGANLRPDLDLGADLGPDLDLPTRA